MRAHFKPRSPEKKIPIDPSVKNFLKMGAPVKEAIKLSDFEQTLNKAFRKKGQTNLLAWRATKTRGRVVGVA